MKNVWKKKLRIKVLPIGHGCKKCVRGAISAHFWQLKIAMVSKIVSANILRRKQMVEFMHSIRYD